MEEKKYYKCIKCKLNYVTKQGEVCRICKRSSLSSGGYGSNCYNGYWNNSNVRTKNCHKCGGLLDANYNKRCTKCRWLICPRCGSCGCNYRK